MIITIDLRMWSSSGIGKVLQNTIPIFIKKFESVSFVLLGKKEYLDSIKWPSNVINIIDFKANIYSINEQIEAIKLIPKETNILWWPHWNIPILYKGILVTSIYDAFHLRMPWSVRNFLKNLYTRLIFYILAKKSLMTLTISNFSKNELIKLTNIKSQDIHIAYPSVDKEWFEQTLSKPLLNSPYIIYVGNVKPHKDLKTLLKAFILNINKIEHKLIIVGKKEGFIEGDKNIEKLAKAYADKIIFTGWINDESVRQYVANADLMVFPSLYEGFGIPPLEAMACQCPVIASDIPVVKEICSDSVLNFKAGDVEDLSTKIFNLIHDKKLQKNLISRGSKLVRKYNWDYSNNIIEKKFQNLINEKNIR